MVRLTGQLLLDCPACGTRSDFILGPTQAFCTNTDCSVICWNPSLPDGGASNPQVVDLGDTE